MKILVTGGNGDMGRSLIPYLLEQGHSVLCIDRFIPPMSGPRPARQPDYMVADMRDYGEVVGALRGCDAVVHLAAHRSPFQAPEAVVYNENTAGSYNVLSAASALGIKRVCLASSINAIGGVFSRAPHYEYFPVDEKHPTYAEDPYSLSKWILEQQADAFARRYDWMTIASLRFHWLAPDREWVLERAGPDSGGAMGRQLWAYTLLPEASRACLLSLTAPFTGHEVFYITAPRTMRPELSRDLAQQYYTTTPIRGDLSGQRSFFDCSKAERILGWKHSE